MADKYLIIGSAEDVHIYDDSEFDHAIDTDGVIRTSVAPTANGEVVRYEDVSNYIFLVNDSLVDALHRHSELSGNDGTPNPALQVDNDGDITIVGNFTLSSNNKLLAFTDSVGGQVTGIYLDSDDNMFLGDAVDVDVLYLRCSDNLYLDAGSSKKVSLRHGTTAMLEADGSDGSVKVGTPGGANYAEFAADGEMTLAGTARVKREFTLELVDLNPGASGPTVAEHGLFPTYEFTIDDHMFGSFEVPG